MFQFPDFFLDALQGVPLIEVGFRLKDDLTVVVHFVDVMDGDAGFLFPVRQYRTVYPISVHALTAVFGQEGGVQVDHPSGKFAGHRRGNQGEVSRQRNEVSTVPSQHVGKQLRGFAQDFGRQGLAGYSVVAGVALCAGAVAVCDQEHDLPVAAVFTKVANDLKCIGSSARSKNGYIHLRFHGAKATLSAENATMAEEEKYIQVPYAQEIKDSERTLRDAENFRETMRGRRSIRRFSSAPVPLALVRAAVETAVTAPSGANKQPWTFCIIGNPEIKRKIRQAAEKEEALNYDGRMSETWKADLRPIGTDARKPFLEEAPYLIAVFKKPFEVIEGKKQPNYYVNESVGIAVGILLAALRTAGLAALTHTPSPMGFLAEILDRPSNERAYLLIPAGLPHPEATVPDLAKKPVAHMVYEYL